MDISQKIQKLYEQTGISPEVHDFGEKIEKSLKETFCIRSIRWQS